MWVYIEQEGVILTRFTFASRSPLELKISFFFFSLSSFWAITQKFFPCLLVFLCTIDCSFPIIFPRIYLPNYLPNYLPIYLVTYYLSQPPTCPSACPSIRLLFDRSLPSCLMPACVGGSIFTRDKMEIRSN